MRTYSHFILTDAISRNHGLSPTNRRALLIGSVLPDIPLTVLTTSYFIARKLKRLGSWIATRDFRDIRCTDPGWVISYNFFHAPLILLPLLLLGYFQGIKRDRQWGRFLFWFVIGCGFHTAMDTATHFDDGPLILFPVDWQIRIKSPLSYWDNRHNGGAFTIVEHLMDGLLVLHMIEQGTCKVRRGFSEVI